MIKAAGGNPGRFVSAIFTLAHKIVSVVSVLNFRRKNVMRRGSFLLSLLLVGFSAGAIACDASDGRWTNCPEPHPGYDDDPCYMTIGALPHHPVYATCASSASEKRQYAQYFYDALMAGGPNGPAMARQWCSWHIQYKDGTWNVYSRGGNNSNTTDVLQLDGWQAELYMNPWIEWQPTICE